MPTINQYRTAFFFLFLSIAAVLSGQKNYRLTLIKGETGILIDSVTVNSTLPNSARALAFPGDSATLTVPVYVPSDKLLINTYAEGNYLGTVECWVDEGKARVFLSVDSGRTMIDSIRGSTLDDWVLAVTREFNAREDITSGDGFYDLLTLASNYAYELVSAPFVRMCLEVWPNDYRKMMSLRNALYDQPGWLRRHPYYKPLLARINLVTYNKSVKLNSFNLIDRGGNPVNQPLPNTPYTVLYFWSLNSPSSDVDHQRMAAEREAEVFPKGVPFIGVCAPADQTVWNNYLRERDIPWISFMEVAEDNKLNSDKLGILVYPTYFLLNRRGRVMGIFNNYDALRKTLEAVADAPKRGQ
ncbi:thioredoxin-like domain-containing protein [Lewinella sp. W8]|uniref:TlpA family protein disulfide reductase n=1 Tax=Lewinella sp. W8 TaxID=2528208 RepID=UPI001067B537|nr:thioredoxin-like domain-containing protein [Lewinella sp. W8]MTB51001.1 hypothetical protein [Lewinella sp. W8]